MDFFENHKKQIIFIVSFVLILCTLLFAGKNSKIPIIQNVVSFTLVPFQKVISSTQSFIGNKFSSVKNSKDLQKENEELKEKVERLESENKRLSLFEKRTEELSTLLDISQKYSDYSTTGAQIIAKDPGNWYNMFVIDKGSKDKLEPNMVAAASGGLVGKIVQTGLLYSKVQSIIDSRSSVSAMSLRTNDLGVVKGDYSLMNSGLCRMEYIDPDAEIIEGDEIVTSHLSDVYPPGITIGYVKEVKTDTNGLTKYAIIEPIVDFKHLDTILIMNELYNKPYQSGEE